MTEKSNEVTILSKVLISDFKEICSVVQVQVLGY